MMRVVFTTLAHPGDAARIIHALVEEKLIACGTLLPAARSIYAWQGKIEDNAETFVMLKTMADRLPELEKRLLELHPYETPEFVVIDPESAAGPYAQWVENCTR